MARHNVAIEIFASTRSEGALGTRVGLLARVHHHMPLETGLYVETHVTERARVTEGRVQRHLQWSKNDRHERSYFKYLNLCFHCIKLSRE